MIGFISQAIGQIGGFLGRRQQLEIIDQQQQLAELGLLPDWIEVTDFLPDPEQKDYTQLAVIIGLFLLIIVLIVAHSKL